MTRKDFVSLATRLDAFCARLNDGLAAVALMLAIVVAGVTLMHNADLLSPVASIDAEGYLLTPTL